MTNKPEGSCVFVAGFFDSPFRLLFALSFWTEAKDLRSLHFHWIAPLLRFSVAIHLVGLPFLSSGMLPAGMFVDFVHRTDAHAPEEQGQRTAIGSTKR